MTVLERIRDYLGQYPGLEELKLDCLPSEAGGFSLNVVSTEPVLETYLDGVQRRRQRMVLRGRVGYGLDVQAQGENLRWFSTFTHWLEEQNRRGELPILEPGQTARSLLPLDTEAVEALGEDGLACYQITLQIIYLQQPTI